MKRYLLCLLLLTAAVLIGSTAWAEPVKVQNSKHNLSVSGPGTYKASSETQICVFCHTPHSARSDAPLWNRTNSSGGYTLYTSDVLQDLGYTQAENPSTGLQHTKTRICLSCHDGTVALGSVVNMPGSAMAGDITMAGDTNIVNTTAGYIGLDLRDDHPVAIKHNAGSGAGKDPELKNPITGKVRLYGLDAQNRVVATTANDNYVECTSCHNPHDNQYGKFLIDSQVDGSSDGANLCRSCHTKETGGIGGLDTLAHDNSSISYNPDGTTPARMGDTVGRVKCMNCHYTHRSGATGGAVPFTANADYGRYLLSFQKETTCFNVPNRWGRSVNVCHGLGSSTKDIETLQTRQSAHKYSLGLFGTKHSATEAGTSANPKYGTLAANWHVECSDCHNPHTAGKMPRAQGTNTITETSPLYGAGGVSVLAYQIPGSNWPILTQSDYEPFEGLGVTNSTAVPAVDYYEYQICFKCHSSYAWGDIPSNAPNSPALGAPMTNQAKEFYPDNLSFHPVAGANSSNEGTLINGWTSGSQTMYCSDCHKDNFLMSEGPHGSNATLGSGFSAAILKANFTDTYSNTATDSQPGGDLCFQCHDPAVYQGATATQAGTGFFTTGRIGGDVNLHNQHYLNRALGSFGYRCVNCHTRIPHGYQNKALIVTGADGADVTTYAAGGAAKISSWTSPPSGQYNPDKSSCSTVAGCH